MQYRFKPLTRNDYPLISEWLSHPHINGWWGTPEAEIALIEDDLHSGKTDMRIVCDGDTPFAYVQDYDTRSFPAPQYADLPQGSRAMDTFLGAPGYLGKGHAAAYLRQRAQQLRANGAPCIAVDPDPNNSRAIATYARAGFAGTRIAPCEDGDPVRIMLFH